VKNHNEKTLVSLPEKYAGLCISRALNDAKFDHLAIIMENRCASKNFSKYNAPSIYGIARRIPPCASD